MFFLLLPIDFYRIFINKGRNRGSHVQDVIKQGLVPGGDSSPIPDAVETQRKTSKALFNVVSIGSTLQRESLTTVRLLTQFHLNAVEQTTGADVSGAREAVDDRFDTVQEVSDRVEDRFLTAMLSTSHLTADYAEFVDQSVERVCPAVDETAT